MNNLIDNIIEIGRDLTDAGVMSDTTLVSLVDLKVEDLQQEVSVLENYIYDLAVTVWELQRYVDVGNMKKDGHKEAFNNAHKVLKTLPDKFLPMYMV